MTEGPPQVEALIVRARVSAWDRWSWRAVVALIPAAGAAVLVVAAQNVDDMPWSVWLLGAGILLFGGWSEAVVWRAGSETLRIAPDGSLLVHSPTLLKRDLVLDPSSVEAVRVCDGVNVPRKATVLTFFSRGEYLRIDLVEPLRLREARFSNYSWALRESRDPWPVPLPHRTIRSLGFIMDRADAEQALSQLGE